MPVDTVKRPWRRDMVIDVEKLDKTIEAAQAGDRDALMRLVDNSLLLINRRAQALRGQVPAVDEVSDFVQKASTAILAAVPRFSADKGAFRNYIFTVLQNAFRQYERFLRREARTVSLETVEEGIADGIYPSPEDMMIEREEKAQQYATIQRALGCLDDEERELVQARYFDGLSLEKISQETGISIMGVSRRVQRVLSKMRKATGVHHGKELVRSNA